ncbi:MAG: hypothetical protein IJV80_04630 [Clostridia bacterium]|nr:hypothetical protein [Clostridia bacterium]
MSALQAILNYQEKDKELYQLERELAASPERKEYAKVRKILDGAPEKLEALETKAVALKTEIAALIAQYEDVVDRLNAMNEDFEHGDELLSSGADLSFYKKKVATASDRVKKLKADLKVLSDDVAATEEEYKALKTLVRSAEKKKVDVAGAYKKVKEEKEPAMNALKAELMQLAKEVPAPLLEKYMAKRKEKLDLPIVGKLDGMRCSLCGMEPSGLDLQKLKEGHAVECETCRRIIFAE